VTHEDQDPDEKLMRSIEELIGVRRTQRRSFARGSLSSRVMPLIRGKSSALPPTLLQEAIERKLMGDLKNVVSLTIADKSRKDPKTLKRRQDASRLTAERYCPVCGEKSAPVRRDILRKEE